MLSASAFHLIAKSIRHAQFLDYCSPRNAPNCLPKHLVYCEGLPNAPIDHLRKGSKGKLAKTIFHFPNADASRSKCSIKVKGQAVNLNDGDKMQVPCLKIFMKLLTTFKLMNVVQILQ